MSTSELTVLALGVSVGAALGLAVSTALRWRWSQPREVRVLVAPGFLPPRTTTLASPRALGSAGWDPARGGPADRFLLRSQAREGTPVPSAGSAASTGGDASASGAEAGATGADAGATAAGAGLEPLDGGACADQRRLVDERCGLYDRLRDQAEAMAVELREMQRAYDGHTNEAERAAAVAEPRALRAAKEAAQISFRRARQAATSVDALESAATDWLQEINRINRSAREALTRAQRERSMASALITRIERMTVETDASRIRAESAMEGCLLAREQLSACEEREASGAFAATAGALAAPPGTSTDPAAAGSGAGQPVGAPVRPGAETTSPFGPQFATDEGELASAAELGEEPAILALLRGDSATLRRLAAALAGDDAAERRRWQLLLGEMAEAIVTRAIDAAYLIYPDDHPFWGPFTRAQCRTITTALASLGFRFDGLGGFVDERVPTYRDLSLAVGYAGLDPKRIRHWPTDAEAGELYRDASVAAGEYLAEAAGGLTLGEMVSLLGRRADPLTDLWNNWGRIRVLLLAP